MNDEIKVGSVLTLGMWPYDRKGTVQPIEWIVVDKSSDGTGLLMTLHGIDSRQYNEKDGSVTWEQCSLRKWLNEEFYNQAFIESEKNFIILETIKTECRRNFISALFSGKTVSTKDGVFLLTAEEAEAFFGSDSKRTAKPTQWAVQQLAFSDTEQDGSCWWWLRSPGAKADMAACVCGGKVNTEGYKVDYNSNSVRPVIKFNINLYKQIKSEAFKERVKQANQQTQENQEENNNNF